MFIAPVIQSSSPSELCAHWSELSVKARSGSANLVSFFRYLIPASPETAGDGLFVPRMLERFVQGLGQLLNVSRGNQVATGGIQQIRHRADRGGHGWTSAGESFQQRIRTSFRITGQAKEIRSGEPAGYLRGLPRTEEADPPFEGRPSDPELQAAFHEILADHGQFQTGTRRNQTQKGLHQVRRSF